MKLTSNMPTEKFCPECEKMLPAEEFPPNRSRPDGLMSFCRPCTAVRPPSRTVRSWDTLSKRCECCERTLSSRMFLFDQRQADKMRPECRTCLNWKGEGEPTATQVEDYESTTSEIIATVAKQFNPFTERAQFDSFVAKRFTRSGLADDWKLPIWVSKIAQLEDT